MKTFVPLQEFLTREVTPEQFIEMLDEIEHTCSMQAIEEPETKEGLYYLHRFRKTLIECK